MSIDYWLGLHLSLSICTTHPRLHLFLKNSSGYLHNMNAKDFLNVAQVGVTPCFASRFVPLFPLFYGSRC